MNNLVNFSQSSEITMTSREIAELTGKRHDNVTRVCKDLINDGVCPQIKETSYVHPSNAQWYSQHILNKRDSLVLVARLSPEFTGHIIDRWIELESQSSFKVPSTLSGALRLAAEQAETIEAQALQLEAAQPAIQMVERYVEAKSSKCLSDVAKILGHKPQSFIQILADDEVIFKRSGSWVPYQHHIDAGRFTVKTGESNGHAFHQTRVEPKGIEWLARSYGVPTADVKALSNNG